MPNIMLILNNLLNNQDNLIDNYLGRLLTCVMIVYSKSSTTLPDSILSMVMSNSDKFMSKIDRKIMVVSLVDNILTSNHSEELKVNLIQFLIIFLKFRQNLEIVKVLSKIQS